MDDLQKEIQIHNLVEEYLATDACKLFKRLKVFEMSYKTLLKNHDEWESAIKNQIPDDLVKVFMMIKDRAWSEPFLIELTRLLHNLVASAQTLIDTTRVLRQELYDPNNTFPAYQQEIDKRFIQDPLSQFVKGLRQYCQHYRLPLTSLSLGVNMQDGHADVNFAVQLTKANARLYSGWTATAKAFIDGASDPIDLQDVMAKYRERVIDFHTWLEQQQRTIHDAEIKVRQYYDAKLQEMKAFPVDTVENG